MRKNFMTQKMKQPIVFLFIIALALSLVLATFNTTSVVHSAASTVPASQTSEAKSLWNKTVCKEKSIWGNTITTPIIVGDSVYAACENYLYQISKSNGTVIKEIRLAGFIDYSYTISTGGNMIFVPINNGRVQAISQETGKSLWVSEGFPGYSSNCTPVYHDGKLFAAISKDEYDESWNWIGSSGIIYCLDTTDKKPGEEAETKQVLWNAEDNEGHYWSTPLVQDNLVLVGSDAGNIYCYQAETGSLLNRTSVTSAAVKAGIIYHSPSQTFYTISSQAEAISFQLNDKQEISNIKTVKLTPNAISPHSTSTPVFCGDKLYLISNYTDANSNRVGFVHVMDKDLNPQYQISTPVMSQSILHIVSNAGVNYIYFTGNNENSSIYCTKDTGIAKTSKTQMVYTPDNTLKQYCCSSVISDNAGTIYYSNDSGTVFAIGKKVSPTPPVSPTPTREPVKIKLPAKVTSLKAQKAAKRQGKKQAVKFSWKSVSAATGYQVYYRKAAKKSYKLIASTKKTYFKKSFAKGTYQVKVRAYKTVQGKKYYGKFSNVNKFKIKLKN